MHSCLGRMFNLWLYFVIVFLIVQGTKGTVRISPNCGTNHGVVRNAVDEAIAMANHAYTRQIGLRDGSLNLRDMRASLNAFNTYFGGLADPTFQTPQNAEFVAREAALTGNWLSRKSSFNKYLYD